MAKFIVHPDGLVAFDGFSYSRGSFALDEPNFPGLPVGAVAHVYDDSPSYPMHHVTDGHNQEPCSVRGCKIYAGNIAKYQAAEAARGYYRAGWTLDANGAVIGQYYDQSMGGPGMESAGDLVTVGRRVAGKKYYPATKAWA